MRSPEPQHCPVKRGVCCEANHRVSGGRGGRGAREGQQPQIMWLQLWTPGLAMPLELTV